MTKTFADLGIPFPLFEAPIEQVTHYCGKTICSLCGNPDRHCFDLEGGDIIVHCERCQAQNPVDANDDADKPCRNCGTPLRFPLSRARALTVCYQCLRAGNAAFVKDTVLGMVSWEQANEGITHGLPGLNHPDFGMIPVADDKEEWVQARVPKDMLFELVRTPDYDTWQGERWQFCCRRPMIYVGNLNQEDFARLAPNGDAMAFYMSIVDAAHDGLWQEGQLATSIGTYVFRCPVCGSFKAHWDID